MYKLLTYACLCFMAICPARAQQANALHFSWPMYLKQRPIGESYFIGNNLKSLLAGNNTEKKTLLNPIGEIKSVVHHEAIFCKMEDALHRHLNIWVKFRMGAEDRYSN